MSSATINGEEFDTTIDPLVPSGKMTYEEYLRWAHEDTLAEWVDGEIMPTSLHTNRQQEVSLFLSTAIRIFVRKRGLGTVFGLRFQMKLARSGREPDIMFLSKDSASRVKEPFGKHGPVYIDGPADLVIEISNLFNRATHRGAKFFEYEEGGVREYWRIDTTRNKAEFYQLGEDGRYRTVDVADDGRYYSRVLEGVWVQSEWFWMEETPCATEVLKEWGVRREERGNGCSVSEIVHPPC